MKLSFIIPTVNQYNMLFNDCVRSLLKANGRPHEVIVVDDGSQPLVQEQILGECGRQEIKCLLNKTNLGFSKTVNRGIEESTGDVVVLVNNDIVFTDCVVNPIVESMKSDPKIGIVGGLLFYPHGTIQHGGILWTGGGFTHRGWHRMLDAFPEAGRSEYMIAVTGALFAIRRKMIDEIGLLNEDFFLSCEDTEYCLRAWNSGWRVFYNGQVRAIHAEGGTRGRTDIEKQSKYRFWYLKELETLKKFRQKTRQYDFDKTLGMINECNESRFEKLAPAGLGAERVVFERESIEIKKSDRSLIVVKRTGALGDVLLATGVIRRLKEIRPDANIIACTACADIFRNNPNVSSVVRSVDVGFRAEKIYDLDLVYETQPKMPIWEAYSRSVFGGYDFDAAPEMFSGDQDYLTLRKKLPIEMNRIVVVHMSTSWPNRTWPRTMWNQVTKSLSSNGYQVIVIGRGGDFRSDMHVGVYNMVDQLTLFEIRELMRRARVFVGIDSGMLHVAQTTEVPIVGLFTVADPKYRIYPRPQKTIALVPRMKCRFCLHDQRPPVTFVACKNESNQCLYDIRPEDVLSAIQELA